VTVFVLSFCCGCLLIKHTVLNQSSTVQETVTSLPDDDDYGVRCKGVDRSEQTPLKLKCCLT